MMQRQQRQPVDIKPLRLFAIVGPDGTPAKSVNGHVIAFEDRAFAESEVGGTGRVVELIEIPAAPPRDIAHGGGQFNHELAPGIRVVVRVTPAGDVVLLAPGGELTITAGACRLGLGLLEADQRATQIRVRHARRARRKTPARNKLSR